MPRSNSSASRRTRDGEHVLSVDLIPIGEAIERLRAANAFEAELLRFVSDAKEMRGS